LLARFADEDTLGREFGDRTPGAMP